MSKRKHRKNKKIQLPENTNIENDEHFAFIAGYTDGGVPFGVTYEEWETEEIFKELNDKNNIKDSIPTDDLPF